MLYAARQSDPPAEAAWQDRMRFRRDFSRQLAQWLGCDGLLAEGWDVEEAADFITALLSPRTYEYLIIERGWPTERFVGRLRQALGSIVRQRSQI
ncbi:MAG: hypothetical protein HY675_14880 [Chloroflexi bacterium]|nr:hypothetical protein [Chloroflexota bacterium]